MKLTQAAFIFLSFLICGSALAKDLGQIKVDMKERQPQVEALWKQGLIGENNQGFLEPRGAINAGQTKLVKEENADRKAVYAAIAASSKSTPEDVGKQRARQISQRAAKGLWLQSSEGEWYKK